jgi:GWxTD domain-containing protein
MLKAFPVGLALLVLGGAVPAAAQGTPCGAAEIAARDTAAAIAACERAVAADPDQAEARYRAGRWYLARFLAAQAVGDREKAFTLIDEATQLRPDSAKYWLALGEVHRTYGDVFRRMQVGGLVDRAVRTAHEHGSGELADIEFRAGVIAWERYEEQAHRYLFVGEAIAVDPYQMLNEWRDVETFFRVQVKPDPGDPGGDDRRASEERLRAALVAEPRHVAATGLLAVLLGEEQRWAEAEEVGRMLVRAAPDSGRAWAVLGAAQARQGRWREAQAAYDTALARMSAAEAAPYRNLGLILKALDQVRVQAMTPAQRAQLEATYWAVSQPLFLSAVNEPRIEYFTRLTYVIHRWTDPFRGLPGYDSDRGAVYLRYGPPDIWATFARGRVSGVDAASVLENERTAIVWVYQASQLRFMFSLTPGFGRTTFAGDFRTFYDEVRDIFPVRFDNVPAVAEMDTILVQFAQFRGEGGESTELGIYTFMPVGRMTRGATVREAELTTAAIVRDGRMRDVQQDRRQELIRADDSLLIEQRSFRFEMQPAEYLLRLEAELPALERAARSTSLLAIRSYGPDSLMLSDVLVAEQVAPRDSAFDRWRDFLVIPSVGRFTPDAPVGLLWEIYNLTPDSTGTARYTVDVRITVRSIERKGFAARILGGIGDAMGLTARGDDAVALSYDRSATARPGGTQVEYLSVQLEDAPKAEYAISLTVTDRVSGASREALRRIVVTETPFGAR